MTVIVTNICKIIFWLVGLCLVAFPFTDQLFNKSWLPQNLESWQSIPMGLIFLVLTFLNIEDVKRIKFLGADLERFERTRQEANELIIKLRKLGLVYKPIIKLMANLGRWDSAPTAKEFNDFLIGSKEIFKDLDYSDEFIEKELRPVHESILIDHLCRIKKFGNEWVSNKKEKQDASFHNKFSDYLAENYKNPRIDTKIDVKKIILEIDVGLSESEKKDLIQELEPLIEDYEFYFERHEYKRLNSWAK